MATNRAEFRVRQALTQAAVELQRTPTNTGNVENPVVPNYYSPTESVTYWVEGIESVTGHSEQADGGESSELEPGRRLPGGVYEQVESAGTARTLDLRHYGMESKLDDEEAKIAMRNFGLDRSEIHSMLALQNLRVNRDRRFNATLAAATHTNTAARSGVWTTSSTTNNYIKADSETALDAILLQSGYTEAVVDALIPEGMIRSLQRAPELNERLQNYQTPPIEMQRDPFLTYLANYMKVRKVHVLDAVRNTARRFLSGTGARIYTGDDVLFTVSTGDNTGNNGTFWCWVDQDGDGPGTLQPNPSGMPEGIFEGRNRLDEWETYRAKEQGRWAVNVELTYLITAISV